MARGLIDQRWRIAAGRPRRDPLQARGERARGAPAHPERLRRRAPASHDLDHRELPAARWVSRHPERRAALHARARAHRAGRVRALIEGEPSVAHPVRGWPSPLALSYRRHDELERRACGEIEHREGAAARGAQLCLQEIARVGRHPPPATEVAAALLAVEVEHESEQARAGSDLARVPHEHEVAVGKAVDAVRSALDRAHRAIGSDVDDAHPGLLRTLLAVAINTSEKATI